MNGPGHEKISDSQSIGWQQLNTNDMKDEEQEAIIRAKQAISPAGLTDRSDKATTLPGNDTPDDSPVEGMDADVEERDETRLTSNTD